ncbi:hypothetical protein GCM10023310_39120 [Paenibacillus vulneris]
MYGYTGLGYDFYSGLSYARARYYKPELGRFISEDTYKGNLWNPQSQNLYGYVHNNPLKYVDPSGMCIAGKDTGCYVDSYSGYDDYLDDEVRGLVNQNAGIWSDLQKHRDKYCKDTACHEYWGKKQKILEAANDEWRNNACSYTDCMIGEARFILENGKATGVRLAVQITVDDGNWYDGISDFISPKAYAADGLPPKRVSPETSIGYIEHRYKSNDHYIPHVHVVDKNGVDIRVGENGKPYSDADEKQMTRYHVELIKTYKTQIRSTVGKIIKYYKRNPDESPAKK